MPEIGEIGLEHKPHKRIKRELLSASELNTYEPLAHVTDAAMIELDDGTTEQRIVKHTGTLYVGNQNPVNAVFKGSTQIFPPIINIEPHSLVGHSSDQKLLTIHVDNNNIGILSPLADGTSYEKVYLVKDALKITYKVGENGSIEEITVPRYIPTSQTNSNYGYIVGSEIHIRDSRLRYIWPNGVEYYTDSFPSDAIYYARIDLNTPALNSLKTTFGTTYYPFAYNYGDCQILRRQVQSLGTGMTVNTIVSSSGNDVYSLELYYNGIKLETNSQRILLNVENPTNTQNHFNNPETFNSSYYVDSQNNGVYNSGITQTTVGVSYITNMFLIAVPNQNYGTTNGNKAWQNNALSNLKKYTPDTNIPTLSSLDKIHISYANTRIGQKITISKHTDGAHATLANFGPFGIIKSLNTISETHPAVLLRFDGFDPNSTITAYSGQEILPNINALTNPDITNVSWDHSSDDYKLVVEERTLTPYSYSGIEIYGYKNSYAYFHLAADIVGFWYNKEILDNKVMVTTTRVIDTTPICVKATKISASTIYTTTIS